MVEHEQAQLLLQYYDTGDPEAVQQIIRDHVGLVIRFLDKCVHDQEIRIAMWRQTVHKLQISRKHPELRFDMKLGTVTGFLMAIAGHLAYRWLVWHERPRPNW